MTHYRSLSADWHGDKPRGCKCYREVGVLCNVCDDLADAKAAEIDGEEVRRGLADDRRSVEWWERIDRLMSRENA